MSKNQVQKVLDRVKTWPPERQADLAHIVELMEEQDESPSGCPTSRPLKFADVLPIRTRRPSGLRSSAGG